MIIPRSYKILSKILLQILQEPTGWLYLVLPRSYKILSWILFKILQEPISWLYLVLLKSYKILSKMIVLGPTKILQNSV